MALVATALVSLLLFLSGCGPVSSAPVDHFYCDVWNQTRDPVTIILHEGQGGVIVAVSSQTIPGMQTGRFELGTAPAQSLELYVPAGALTFPVAVFTWAGGPCPFWVWNVDYPSGYGFGSVPVTGASNASPSPSSP
jgi:hypothetical protein